MKPPHGLNSSRPRKTQQSFNLADKINCVTISNFCHYLSPGLSPL
jgi:hypothetical protein